jgi:hypothetical protein
MPLFSGKGHHHVEVKWIGFATQWKMSKALIPPSACYINYVTNSFWLIGSPFKAPPAKSSTTSLAI